jgi:hypothetical protein
VDFVRCQDNQMTITLATLQMNPYA